MSGWSWTSHTPSIVENCGGSGVSDALGPGSGVLLRRPRRPAGAGVDDAAGAGVIVGPGPGGVAAGTGVPINVPGVATLPLGGGGGGGVTWPAGPDWPTCATAVPPTARAATATSTS